MNGSEFDSNASRGLVLAVTFFAGTSAASDAGVEAAGALYGSHSELVIVGVSLDESVDSARSQVARHSLHFPVLFDPDRRVAERLGVTRPQTMLAVDRRGVLRWVGDSTNRSVAEQAAEALLAESG